ncbi:MAG TPA: glutamate-cysteine ligase family protein [Polyangiaceae bacterium]
MNELVFPWTLRSNEEPPIGYDDLAVPFLAAEKRVSPLRVGVESEKFGLLLPSFTPVPYSAAVDGDPGADRAKDRSVTNLLSRFVALGFSEQREQCEGPVVSLLREQASITLEPGAQLELSGAPHVDLHSAALEIERHHAELTELSKDLGMAWCSIGFHPFAKREELPWVPKLRYPVMREYLPSLGDGALDMMLRTATVQVNLDYTSEADAMRKLRAMLRISPLVHAMTGHSPLREGHLTDNVSLRGDVWTRMDKSRSGLIDKMWSDREFRYIDYIEWALDAGMFLIKRHGEMVPNTGQSFRDFLRRGYQGHRATLSDWRLHLNTLFPEVRLKNTLEARCSDAQPKDTMMAVPAFWVGLIYDEAALSSAEALASRYSLSDVRESRADMIGKGLQAKLGEHSVAELCVELLQAAKGGLQRRALRNAAHQDECIYLQPLINLVEAGESPGDRLRRELTRSSPLNQADIVEMIRVA